jgi:hypothetical protein
MFEDRTMPSEPEDQLERLLAADEAAIGDDGFTRRVMDSADKGLMRRRTAIYGAGLAGLGFAIGGFVEMAPHLPNMTGWLDGLVSSVNSASVQEAVRSSSDATQLAIVAVLAGVTFLVTAFTLQNR